MKGSLSHESVVGAPAEKVWECYGTIRLVKLASELLPDTVEKIEILEGDGGVGTILHLQFQPDPSGSRFSFKEKLIIVDSEKLVKEAEVVEGGYLDLGFRSYHVRLEVEARDENSSIVKSTIEYEIEDELAGNASLVTVQPLIAVAKAVEKHLISKKPE